MKTAKFVIISGIFVALLTGAKAVAQQGEGFDREAYMASLEQKKVLELRLTDCIGYALKSNSEIKVTKIEPLKAISDVRIAKSEFEPHFTFDWEMEDDTYQSPTTLADQSTGKARTGTFNFGLDQKFTTGTELELNFYNTRTRSNSAIQIMNPEFESEAEIVITQPLLKGFGIPVNKANYMIAKNNKLKSDQDFIGAVIDVLTDVKRKYYIYQYTQEQYRVALASLERVESLNQIIIEKYAKGIASNVDLLQSEAELARMEEAVLAADNMMHGAEDALKYVTNLIDDVELWNSTIVLLDKMDYEKTELNVIKSVEIAFARRPDYQAANLNLKNKDISVVYYRNGMLPTLDLQGSYGLNGLAKNFEKDLGNIGGGKYPDWTVGVAASMPLFADEEKGKYEKSKYDKQQTLISFQRLEEKIIQEVREAVRNVATAYDTLEASLKSLRAQEKNYEAQETRFKAGLVSTHDIVDYQERLARAELSYVQSITDYKVSLAALAKAQGTTLIDEGVSIQ